MTAGYRNLDVWKKSKELAVQVYLFTKDSSLERDYGLVDQMRRSSVSIASNIAEGDERDSNKDAIRFFYIARGSAAELYTQLEIASEVYPALSEYANELKSTCDEISRMLHGLIASRKKYL